MKCQRRNCTDQASEIVRIRVEGRTFSRSYHLCFLHLMELQKATNNGTTVAGNKTSEAGAENIPHS